MTAAEPKTMIHGPILRWLQPSKGAQVGLVLLASFVAFVVYAEHAHSKKLDALRAIHDMGGKAHQEDRFKDEVEGEFVEIDMRNAPLTDAGVDHIITLSPKKRLLLDSDQLTEKGLKKLRRAMPNCKIEFGTPTKDERQSRPSADQPGG